MSEGERSKDRRGRELPRASSSRGIQERGSSTRTDLRRGATEGLSYLTLDAKVKEKLGGDEPATRALIELGKSGAQNGMDGVMAILINLTNRYDKQEINPEMLDLAKFAKHHIPEEHKLDDEEFTDKQICTSYQLGATAALVALSKTESRNMRKPPRAPPPPSPVRGTGTWLGR